MRRSPGLHEVFYTTTPPSVYLAMLRTGELSLGNLTLRVRPNVVIGPRDVVERLHAEGEAGAPVAFARSRGNAYLVRAGNPKGIRGVADLLRPDVVLFMSNPDTEAASYGVYRETILATARIRGLDMGTLERRLSGEGDPIVFGERIHHREAPQVLADGEADVAMVYYHLALRYVRIFPGEFEIVCEGWGPGTGWSPRTGRRDGGDGLCGGVGSVGGRVGGRRLWRSWGPGRPRQSTRRMEYDRWWGEWRDRHCWGADSGNGGCGCCVVVDRWEISLDLVAGEQIADGVHCLQLEVETGLETELRHVRTGFLLRSCRLRSSKHQAFALRLRDWSPQLSRSFDPELHRVIDVPQRVFLIVTVRHAPGQFGHLGDERLVFVAPVENDLVLVHQSSPPSLYFRINCRTCLT